MTFAQLPHALLQLLDTVAKNAYCLSPTYSTTWRTMSIFVIRGFSKVSYRDSSVRLFHAAVCAVATRTDGTYKYTLLVKLVDIRKKQKNHKTFETSAFPCFCRTVYWPMTLLANGYYQMAHGYTIIAPLLSRYWAMRRYWAKTLLLLKSERLGNYSWFYTCDTHYFPTFALHTSASCALGWMELSQTSSMT